MRLAILISLVALAWYAISQPLPPMPTESGVLDVVVTNEPIRDSYCWNAQADADVYSLVFRGVTNLTTGTNYTLDTPPGTNRLELRAHKGSLASAPVVTNIVVSVDTIVDHWPETSSKVTGPWSRMTFGSVTNPTVAVAFVRVGQSLTVQTNKDLR